MADATAPDAIPRLRGLTRAYPALTRLIGPAVGRLLKARIQRGKEDPERIGERQGHAGLARPGGPLIWFHGASVGESLSILPLIGRLRMETPQTHVLVTTGTLTSARLLAERLPEGAMHQYVPLDHPAFVDRFLDHWQPDLALWVESEFWPNLLHRTGQRAIPMVLVNARISDRSFQGWQRFPDSIAGLLGHFSSCLAPDEEAARRLQAFKARAVTVTGNLKLVAAPLPAEESDLAALQGAIGGRPVWLAASTHDEEETVADAHGRIVDQFPDLLTIIAPRQPNRGDDIVRMLCDHGLTTAQRSKHEPLTGQTQVYVADTIGEMGLFFRLAPVSFLGRSLVPMGGSNPLEAARLDSAVLHGPHTDNFRATYQALNEAGAALKVETAETLAAAVTRLLQDETARQDLTARAGSETARADGVLDRVMGALAPYLPGAEARVP